MQQTQKYKLNLIETSDTFSPAPLNENMEKLETALGTETAALQSADSSLRSRVSTLENSRITTGTYDGETTFNNVAKTISLGFTPRVVLIQGSSSNTAMATSGFTITGIEIVSGGFRVSNLPDGWRMNYSGRTYTYCAIP